MATKGLDHGKGYTEPLTKKSLIKVIDGERSTTCPYMYTPRDITSQTFLKTIK